ncbi:Rab subfamily of small GTPases [Paramecium bursaria]
MTVAVDYRNKIVEYKNFHAKLQIFDTSGQQRFRQLLGSYMRYVDAAFIFYDVTDPQSPDQVRQWVAEFKENTTQVCDINLVANKIDIDDRRLFKMLIIRVITSGQGRALAQELGLQYFETTVRDLNTINIMFDQVVNNLINQYKKKKANPFKSEVQEKNYLKENKELQEKIQYYQDVILIQKCKDIVILNGGISLLRILQFIYTFYDLFCIDFNRLHSLCTQNYEKRENQNSVILLQYFCSFFKLQITIVYIYY